MMSILYYLVNFYKKDIERHLSLENFDFIACLPFKFYAC